MFLRSGLLKSAMCDIFAQHSIDQRGSDAYCAHIALEKFPFRNLSTQILTFSIGEAMTFLFMLYFWLACSKVASLVVILLYYNGGEMALV